MPLDLTTVKFNINNIKRNLFFEDGITLKFYKVNQLLLEIQEGWYMHHNAKSKLPVIDPVSGSEEYYYCSVVQPDDGSYDLNVILPNTTHVIIGDTKYTIDQYMKPRGVTIDWKIRLGAAKKL